MQEEDRKNKVEMDENGKLYVVGMGCGSREGMTLEAQTAIMRSDLIVGYTVYTDLLREMFPEKEMCSTGMRKETERVTMALDEAARGRIVSLICSGDAAVYGMAALAIELGEKMRNTAFGKRTKMSTIVSDEGAAPEGRINDAADAQPGKGAVPEGRMNDAANAQPDKEQAVPEIIIVPGVTAALSGGAVLGAPPTSDFAVISLSDLLTPMEKIEKRLRSAAEADFTIVLYNPSSKGRPHHLNKACEILLEILPPETCCGYVRQIGRSGQESGLLTLFELRDFQADMFTTVFIGSSDTVVIGGRLVTPRGYHV